MDETQGRRYAQGRLAQARIAAGLSQVEAARRLGFSHKQALSAVERGQVVASSEMMKGMASLYRLAPVVVLDLCTDAFETGALMRRHLRRKLKLAVAGRRATK
jgi:transcriptional regulator with XRE-family HTH domain